MTTAPDFAYRRTTTGQVATITADYAPLLPRLRPVPVPAAEPALIAAPRRLARTTADQHEPGPGTGAHRAPVEAIDVLIGDVDRLQVLSQLLPHGRHCGCARPTCRRSSLAGARWTSALLGRAA